MGLINIGRITGAISTNIRTRIDEEKKKKAEEEAFNKEYEEKLKTERRKAKLDNAARIAKAEADLEVKKVKKGQAPAGKPGIFKQVTGQDFFMKGGSPAPARHAKGKGQGSSGGHPWTDSLDMGMGSGHPWLTDKKRRK